MSEYKPTRETADFYVWDEYADKWRSMDRTVQQNGVLFVTGEYGGAKYYYTLEEILSEFEIFTDSPTEYEWEHGWDGYGQMMREQEMDYWSLTMGRGF